jgi:hypothetical protein
MRYCVSAISLLCVFLASSAWAGQKICASPPENSQAILELPGGKQNTLYVKGEPSARFLIRFDWTCRKGHTYRRVGSDIIRIPLGHCYQSGKLNITVRKGCAIFEVDSERAPGRGRR